MLFSGHFYKDFVILNPLGIYNTEIEINLHEHLSSTRERVRVRTTIIYDQKIKKPFGLISYPT